MSVWAVGDLQGCHEPFERLLEKIRFDATQDRLWLVGDLVNRGPQSLAVLRRVYELRERVSVVLGNHDLHLLAVAAGAQTPRRKDTFGDILGAPDRGELLGWLQQQPLLHYDAALNTVMTHAGIPPAWSLFDAQRLAREVSDVLRSAHAGEFFRAMYGNEPARWDESLTGMDRLRVITNHFTRMRFVDTDGRLDLDSKEGLDSAPAGFFPWFDAANRRCAGLRIVFGHWAALQGRVDVPDVLALDTGCVWGYSLTAVNLASGERVSCECTAAS
ncbi:MAG: symmetrical bis(5'-nucleosyl)-tetraphosphatase [Gammaproteobacteria bacterium]